MESGSLSPSLLLSYCLYAVTVAHALGAIANQVCGQLRFVSEGFRVCPFLTSLSSRCVFQFIVSSSCCWRLPFILVAAVPF